MLKEAQIKKPEEKVCEHEWKRFKQRITPDNPKFTHTGAYMVVMACLKCHEKRNVELIIE